MPEIPVELELDAIPPSEFANSNIPFSIDRIALAVNEATPGSYVEVDIPFK